SVSSLVVPTFAPWPDIPLCTARCRWCHVKWHSFSLWKPKQKFVPGHLFVAIVCATLLCYAAVLLYLVAFPFLFLPCPVPSCLNCRIEVEDHTWRLRWILELMIKQC